MASSVEKCNFCNNEMNVPQKGWRLRDSTYAKLCVSCSYAFRDGTFCHQYHKGVSGWRKCDGCGKEVHCGCIMALHTYEVKDDASGVTCKDCLENKNLVVSNNVTASSSVPSVKDNSQLDDFCSSEFVIGVKPLADPDKSNQLNDGS